MRCVHLDGSRDGRSTGCAGGRTRLELTMRLAKKDCVTTRLRDAAGVRFVDALASQQFGRVACSLVFAWVGVCGLMAGKVDAQCFEEMLTDDNAAASALLGGSVAIDGDVAVVGVPGDPVAGWDFGHALVFRRIGVNWVEEQRLDGFELQDLYGTAVTISEDALVVGAPAGDGFSPDSGLAYVYRFSGSSWLLEQTLQAADGATGDKFGQAVSIDGPFLIVGAPGDDAANASDPNCDSGSIYTFASDGGAWSDKRNLVGSVECGAFLGASVSLAGYFFVAGAPGADAGAGRAQVYVHYPPNVWDDEGELFPENGLPGDQFGASVATSGAEIVVGTPGDDESGIDSGSAATFRQSIFLGWIRSTLLKLTAGMTQDRFGASVAKVRGLLVVGAPGRDTAVFDGGALYTFSQDGLNWVADKELVVSNAAASDRLGNAVAMSDGAILVGASARDTFGADSGAAYIYRNADRRNYGSGWPGTRGLPGLSPDADPTLFENWNLVIGNSLGSPTSGSLLVGLEEASVETALGGTLLVVPQFILPLSIPQGSLSLGVTLPCEAYLSGQTIYLQALQLDSGASQGVAFSKGLRLVLGQY